jgi:hypothetical protein
MIVQTAPHGEKHFVITQIDHARASGELAQHFGNADFVSLAPHAEMVYMVAHHDEGWAQIDATMRVDPKTHRPYHLTQTPILRLIATGNGSPDHNEHFHPYSGLISSMHTWGLYHGRYGLSDKVFIDNFPPDYRPEVDAMLAREQARQMRLKMQLREDATYGQYVEHTALMHNYKLLQFFDTLSLYFHTTHASQHAEAHFLNVPKAVGDDLRLTITPLGEKRYRLAPFPFSTDEVTFSTHGRYLGELANDANVADIMANTPLDTQTFYLVR